MHPAIEFLLLLVPPAPDLDEKLPNPSGIGGRGGNIDKPSFSICVFLFHGLPSDKAPKDDEAVNGPVMVSRRLLGKVEVPG